MRIAIIDCGTNTFNILIADTGSDGVTTIHKDKIPVKLGEGGLNTNIIVPAAFARGLEAMRAHKDTLDSFDVDKIVATATSGIRSTSNGLVFVAQVKAATGITIEVIDGQREAELIHKGVRDALELSSEPELIMDMGGGSTEFIICTNEAVLWKQSFKLGVSRIKERFAPSDPILPKEVEALETFLEAELQPLFRAMTEHSPKTLIGCSGSFDSIVDMIHHQEHGTAFPTDLTTYEFDLAKVVGIHELLMRSTQEQRLQIPGLVAFRADMMVLASLFIHFITKRLNMQRMRLSTYALKEGLIAENNQ